VSPLADAGVAPKTSTRTRSTAGISHVCARCGVVIRFMPGHERSGLPNGWKKERGETYCLGCRRERAAEAGIASVSDKLSLADRAKMRTMALVEFEIKRDPERPNGEIAKVARCSVPAVAKVRRKLEGSA
jgi:hypothetical protein